MRWVYFNKLYRTKFQAGCLARRLEQDGWIYGFDDMREIEISALGKENTASVLSRDYTCHKGGPSARYSE
ncbi:hypothetical protein HMSSN036_21340 [Paenibacillus macerans]|nr:hypothetical protein HMSSN036_21340 [Paenibacillus macerans]